MHRSVQGYSTQDNPSASKRRIAGVAFAIVFIGIAVPFAWYWHAGHLQATSTIDTLPFRESPLHEQWAAVLAFFGIKALYTIATAWIIARLWRRSEPDLAALRRAMIAFFIGEAFCAINVLGFHDQSILLEHLHSAGMVLSLGFATYALLEGVDARIIHFSGDGRCAAAGLCRGCAKHSDVPCGLRRMFIVLVASCAVLASYPLFSSLRETAYNTHVLGAMHTYRHLVVHQRYELRFLPAAAALLFCACLAVLLWRERRDITISKLLFSAAAGALGFSLLRLFLVASFINNQVWFALWEELTELLYIGLVAGVLLVFPVLGRGFARETEQAL